MLIQDEPINEDETTLEIRIVPLMNAILVQLSSDTIRGTFVMDSSLEKEEMDKITMKIFNFIEEISMRSLTDADEIPQ
jgi:propanediol dehydratase large subunit